MNKTAKARNTAVVLLIFLSNCLAFSVREADAAIPSTHRLNTAELGLKLDYDGSRVRFQSDYIYLGNDDVLWSYLDDDTLKFYNIKMGASQCLPTWTVSVIGPANLTITKFFVDDTFEADVIANSQVTSTTKIYCAKPTNVQGADAYNWQNNILTITVNHQSARHLKVIFQPLITFTGELIDALTAILSVSLVVALVTFLVAQLAPKDSIIRAEIERYTAIILGVCLLAAMIATLGLLSYI